MNNELCNKCVQSKNADKHLNSVCEVCYQIGKIGNGNNSHFVEKIGVPNCCGDCNYCVTPPLNIFLNEKPYCKASETFDKDERNIYLKIIRKNYLKNGVPKWCPLKDN